MARYMLYASDSANLVSAGEFPTRPFPGNKQTIKVLVYSYRLKNYFIWILLKNKEVHCSSNRLLLTKTMSNQNNLDATCFFQVRYFPKSPVLVFFMGKHTHLHQQIHRGDECFSI